MFIIYVMRVGLPPLTNFKPAWKIAILLALVTAKHCSDLTLLYIDNQCLSIQCHAPIFILASGGKTNQFGYHPPQIHVESCSSVNLFLACYLKAYLHHAEPSFGVTIGSTCQYVLKLFLLGYVKFLVLQRHMSLGTFRGAVVSAAYAAGISLVSILQAGNWARVSTPARHCFSTYVITTNWHQDSIQHTVQGLSE